MYDVSSSVAPDVAGVRIPITVDSSSKLKLQLEISADTLDSCELKSLTVTNSICDQDYEFNDADIGSKCLIFIISLLHRSMALG